MIDTETLANCVTSHHKVTLSLDLIHPTIEDLSIGEHPEAINNVEHRCNKKEIHSILGKSIIKTRRDLIGIGNTVTFKHPEND